MSVTGCDAEMRKLINMFHYFLLKIKFKYEPLGVPFQESVLIVTRRKMQLSEMLANSFSNVYKCKSSRLQADSYLA